MKKKGQISFNQLLPFALGLVALIIAVTVGLEVVVDQQSGFTADTAEYNAAADGITGLGKLTNKTSLIVTVVVAAVILGVLVTALAIRR